MPAQQLRVLPAPEPEMAASVSAYSTEAVDVDADSRPGSSAVAPAGGSAAAPPINPTADVEAPMMVYGISIQDYAQARLTKRVLNISILMGLMAIVFFVWGLLAVDSEANSSIGEAVSELITALLIPLCGYFGAKDSNRSLLACFWICNFVGIIGAVAGAMSWVMFRSAYVAHCIENNGSGCTATQDAAYCQQTCKETKSYSETPFLVMMFSSLVVHVLLQGAGCLMGKRLYDHGDFRAGAAGGGDTGRNAPVVMASVIALPVTGGAEAAQPDDGVPTIGAVAQCEAFSMASAQAQPFTVMAEPVKMRNSWHQP